MSTDEEKITLGQEVLDLRAQQLERQCLQNKAAAFMKVLTEVFQLHKEGKHDEQMIQLLQQLPDNDTIVQTFQKLVHATAQVTRLKQTLDV